VAQIKILLYPFELHLNGMRFSFAKSSRCLICLSITVWEGPDRCAIDGDDFTPLVDEACIHVDMTFLAMRSMRISSMDLSIVLKSPDIHARDLISQVGEQIIKVGEWMVRSQ
jgi:hypothetical protein